MIVGVAIRSESVMIQLPRPNRHHHCFAYCKNILKVHATENGIGLRADDQGFVTDRGVYLDRAQAMRHVRRCGQKLVVQPDGSINKSKYLFSEDIW